MQAIQTGLLLEAWEQGQSQHPLHRALTLLRISDPNRTVDALAALTIGERDRRLVELRRRLFGSRLEAVAICSRCGERLEMGFTIDDLPGRAEAAVSAEVTLGGQTVTLRLPNTVDLLEVASAPSEHRADALLARCAGTELSGETAEAVQSKMAEMDPMAHVEIRLSCPACGHSWMDCFDIASYLWTELNDHALRLLRETHTLARAYGWREADILAMSPRRRQVYLDLVMGA